LSAPIDLVPDEQTQIEADIAAISRIDVVPRLLRIICSNTGMGFAAVARVSDRTWTVCAVQDNISFGLKPGNQLDLKTTLCYESRGVREPIVIDHASQDPVYSGHHTPIIYKIESYISVPIILSSGVYFGNLCAIDPDPKRLKDGPITDMFIAFAELIALHLENERKRVSAETALLDAQQTADLREQFIAVLGHDLRNPLAAMSAAAAVIERGTTEPKTRTLAHSMSHSVRRMSRLINDVMDFAQARLGGGLGVKLTQNTDLEQVLQHAVDEIKLASDGRTVVTAFAISEPVTADRDRLQQLLSNLVSNALTHGSAVDPVVVRAVTRDREFVLEVMNQGRPIPADALRKVFLPYWRPESSLPGQGLGLGLFIASQIVTAHHGSINVTSSSEEGTVFRVILPIH
jgi:signal transduction histidine kinase